MTRLAKLEGQLFHGLRGSAVRILIASGPDEAPLIRIIGWRTTIMLQHNRIFNELLVSRAGLMAESYRELVGPQAARERPVAARNFRNSHPRDGIEPPVMALTGLLRSGSEACTSVGPNVPKSPSVPTIWQQ